MERELTKDSFQEFIGGFEVNMHRYFSKEVRFNEMDKDTFKLYKELLKFQREMPIHYANTTTQEQTYFTLQKVYDAEETDIWEITEIINQSVHKFLNEYVNISGMDRLFDANYFTYEWGMHLEYQSDKRNYSFYRDHYVHQVKDMYEMFVWLDDFNLLSRCIEIYRRPANKIGRYILQCVEEEFEHYTDKQKELFKGLPQKESYVCNEKKFAGMTGEEFAEWLIFKNILYSAMITASLIHDIGYPIAYLLRNGKELIDFQPIANKFFKADISMADIHDDLSESLLFELVNYSDIEKRIEARDHGAISAIVLLSYYYSSGRISKLSPMQRCTVDLAALMIYKHTLKYKILEDKKPDLHQMLFVRDPLSFLFRLCDDIQEWDRVYFNITRQRNFFICHKCGWPLYYDKSHKIYICRCAQEDGNGQNLTAFHYRRIMHITACERVVLSSDIEDTRKEENSKQKDIVQGGSEKGNTDQIAVITKEIPDQMQIHIEYDLFALLQLAAFDIGFAIKRGEELKKIKILLHHQSDFPECYVKSFLSANPILLKVRIIEEFLQKTIEYCNKFQTWSRKAKEIQDILKETEFQQISDKQQLLDKIQEKQTILQIPWKTVDTNSSWHKQWDIAIQYHTAEKLDFYIRLLYICKLAQNIPESSINSIWSLCKESNILIDYAVWDETTSYLCKDAIYQYWNEITESKWRANRSDNKIEEKYENMYQCDTSLRTRIKAYAEYEKYGEMLGRIHKEESVKIEIDYFSDMFLFYLLNDVSLALELDEKD